MSTRNTDLAAFVPRFSGFRIAVVGDMMLDRYIFGRASRISPEAPVPVVAVEREQETAGGASNVTRNILGLGGKVVACGVVGNDARGDALVRLLENDGADCSCIIRTPDRPTTVKTRVIANNQQVVRIDRELTTPVPPEVRAALEEKIMAMIRAKSIQAIVFEDYAKGLLDREMMQRLADFARANGVITSLDPHPSQPFVIRGLTLMTPNRAEAFGLAGAYYRGGVHPIENDRPLLDVSKKLCGEWQVEQLLVTLGADGMALFMENRPVLHIPTKAREVFDVSGAGDTVIATFTLSLLAGATPAQSAEISNHAAGVVVAKVGTVPITAPELLVSLAAG